MTSNTGLSKRFMPVVTVVLLLMPFTAQATQSVSFPFTLQLLLPNGTLYTGLSMTQESDLTSFTIGYLKSVVAGLMNPQLAASTLVTTWARYSAPVELESESTMNEWISIYDFSQSDTLVFTAQGSVANDPTLVGFDGVQFHFDQLGDFVLLQEAEGVRVDVTFSGAKVVESEGGEPRDKSWTSAVRVYSPNGDMISCSLPAITPNTSRVTMMATPADPTAPTSLVGLTHTDTQVKMREMEGTAILTWKRDPLLGEYFYVVGCKIHTPKISLTVYQVSGWEEALAKPEEHGWAAPYTWLNTDFSLHQTLQAPVTGIIGSTYPTNKATAANGRQSERASLQLPRSVDAVMESK